MNRPEYDEFSFTVWTKGASDARGYRALTPSDAAEKRAREDYDGASCWQADYRVQNNGTGKLYDVSVGVVPQPTFVAIETRDVPMPPATHVLWDGRALCADLRLRRVPGEWPDGQQWISLKDVADRVAEPPDPCAGCWSKAPALVEKIQQIGKPR